MYTLMAQTMLDEQWTENEYDAYLASLLRHARWDGVPAFDAMRWQLHPW